MKKFLLPLITFLFLTTPSFGQKSQNENVAKECVLFEVFTGVRCPYCPAAANGIAQLLEEGKAVAPLAYHTNAFSTEEYYTSETNARANYYIISSYPTLKTDGILSHSGGGNASQSNYSAYLSRYNQRINIQSPFTIEMTCESLDDLCHVNCTVNQVGENNSSNLRLFIALTQSNIDVTWQGMSGLHHVVRDLIPTHTGTVYSGGTMTVSESFELKNFPKEDCYLTAWIQDYSTKEVFQTVRLSLAMDLDRDLVVKSLTQFSDKNCSGMANPRVAVKNSGNETVTSFDLVAYADGNPVSTYAWTGSLPKGETTEVLMPEFSFGSATNLKFIAELPNGQYDEFQADNHITKTISETDAINGYIKMQLKTDSNPEETTVEIVNTNTGEVVYSLTFDQANHVTVEEFYLNQEGCYRFSVKDSAGNGMGSGFFALIDANNQLLFRGGATFAPFEYELPFEFSSDGTVGLNDNRASETVIFPNPSDGKFIFSTSWNVCHVCVYDLAGRVVYDNKDFHNGEIDLLNCDKGVYFVKATNGKESMMKKIIIY
jgi:hypothetical protein